MNKIIEDVLTRPKKFYIGIFITPPDVFGKGRELSASNYKRQRISFDTTSNGTISNTNKISFPENKERKLKNLYIAIFDSEKKGNMLMFQKLQFDLEVDKNMRLEIPKNYLTIEIDCND